MFKTCLAFFLGATHQAMLTSPSLPSPLIIVTPKPSDRRVSATSWLSSSFGENIRITTSPIAIDVSIYDPTIVPEANPSAYPNTRNGLSKSLITCEIATTQIAD